MGRGSNETNAWVIENKNKNKNEIKERSYQRNLKSSKEHIVRTSDERTGDS